MPTIELHTIAGDQFETRIVDTTTRDAKRLTKGAWDTSTDRAQLKTTLTFKSAAYTVSLWKSESKANQLQITVTGPKGVIHRNETIPQKDFVTRTQLTSGLFLSSYEI